MLPVRLHLEGGLTDEIDAPLTPSELLREENLKKIEASLTEAVRLAASCGLGKEDLREMLELLWED